MTSLMVFPLFRSYPIILKSLVIVFNEVLKSTYVLKPAIIKQLLFPLFFSYSLSLSISVIFFSFISKKHLNQILKYCIGNPSMTYLWQVSDLISEHRVDFVTRWQPQILKSISRFTIRIIIINNELSNILYIVFMCLWFGLHAIIGHREMPDTSCKIQVMTSYIGSPHNCYYK